MPRGKITPHASRVFPYALLIAPLGREGEDRVVERRNCITQSGNINLLSIPYTSNPGWMCKSADVNPHIAHPKQPWWWKFQTIYSLSPLSSPLLTAWLQSLVTRGATCSDKSYT
jgi:hypothetical protein